MAESRQRQWEQEAVNSMLKGWPVESRESLHPHLTLMSIKNKLHRINILQSKSQTEVLSQGLLGKPAPYHEKAVLGTYIQYVIAAFVYQLPSDDTNIRILSVLVSPQ